MEYVKATFAAFLPGYYFSWMVKKGGEEVSSLTLHVITVNWFAIISQVVTIADRRIGERNFQALNQKIGHELIKADPSKQT